MKGKQALLLPFSMFMWTFIEFINNKNIVRLYPVSHFGYLGVSSYLAGNGAMEVQ